MQLGSQVEWALHCAATLAGLGPGQRLSAAALAELYEVPPKYLAKAVQAMAAAGLIQSTPGPRGGYALARPPEAIRLIDIVDAVEGCGVMFRCQNIRRRGPCKDLPAREFAKPCQLAEAMWRAESAWRRELEAATLATIVADVRRDVPPIVLRRVNGWIKQKKSTG